jgi:hypothetical protein
VLQKWILVLGGGVFRAFGLVCIGCRLLCLFMDLFISNAV